MSVRRQEGSRNFTGLAHLPVPCAFLKRGDDGRDGNLTALDDNADHV